MRKIFVVVVALVLVLQGCSSNAPSSSDAENSVKAAFADCPNLAVENFNLLNGQIIDEVTHEVSVQFDLRVVPLPDSVLGEHDKLQQQRDAEQKAIDDQYDETRRKYKALETEQDRIDSQIDAELRASGLRGTSDEYFARHDVLAEQYGLRKIQDEMKALNNLLHAGIDAPQPTTNVFGLKGKWGSEACLMKSGVDWVGHPGALDDAVRNGHVKTIKATFSMIKTDNGWMGQQG